MIDTAAMDPGRMAFDVFCDSNALTVGEIFSEVAAVIRAEVEREMVGRVEALYDDLDPKAIRPRPPFMLGRIHEVQRVLAALKGQDET